MLGVGARDRVLEVGFGPGVGIEVLAKLGSAQTIVGIDPSPEMCEQARKRNAMYIASGRISLRQGCVESLPFTAAEFDRALTIRSVQLWADATAGLREIRRVLRPGGRIVCALARDSGQTPQRLAEILVSAGFAGVQVLNLHGSLYARATQPLEAGGVSAGWCQSPGQRNVLL